MNRETNNYKEMWRRVYQPGSNREQMALPNQDYWTSFPTVGINVSEAQDLKEGLLPPLREWQVLEPESLLRIGGFSLSPTSEPVSMWSLATPFLGADLRFYLISKFWWMLLPLKVKSKHPGLLLLEGLQYYDLVSMLSLSHPHCHTAILYTTVSL